MEYDSVITRNEVLMNTSRNTENIMLNAVRQPQKDKCCMIHVYEISRRSEFLQREVDFLGYRGWGEAKTRSIAS